MSTTSPSGSASHPEDTSENVAVLAAQSASGKGATDLLVLAMGPILAICEHFVIGTASNTRLVMAAAQEVEDKLAEVFGRRPIAVEGREDRRWVLLDYGDVVVHMFLDEDRDFYRLERLYGDAVRVPWQLEAAAVAE